MSGCQHLYLLVTCIGHYSSGCCSFKQIELNISPLYAGKSGYWAVIFFQQVASLGNNITIQIVAGQAMKVCVLTP